MFSILFDELFTDEFIICKDDFLFFFFRKRYLLKMKMKNHLQTSTKRFFIYESKHFDIKFVLFEKMIFLYFQKKFESKNTFKRKTSRLFRLYHFLI